MALPASGAISLGQVNTELGVSSTATRSLGDATTRTLFGVASGAISMSQGYGKANQFAFTISSNQTNANLRTLAVNAGWNQSTKVVATINSGIYISSNGTGTPALTVNGSFPGGVELVNNGFIVGMGGAGASANPPSQPAGSGGGLALSVSSAISITNNNTIGGGGGGGGAGQAQYDSFCGVVIYGGNGGGGRTGTTNSAAGSGPISYPGLPYGGTAASQGTLSGGGGGGLGANPGGGGRSGAGGTGGNWGSSGGSGGAAAVYGGFSGYGSASGGGGGGAAVSGNGNITWLATGTRLGSIS